MMDITMLVRVAEHEAKRTGKTAYVWIKPKGKHKGWAVDTDFNAISEAPTFFFPPHSALHAPMITLIKP